MANYTVTLDEKIKKAQASVVSTKTNFDAAVKNSQVFSDYELFLAFAHSTRIKYDAAVVELENLLLKKRKLRHLKLVTNLGCVARTNSQGFSAYDFAFLNGCSESQEILKKSFRNETISDENWIISRLRSHSGYVREAYLQYVIDHFENNNMKYLYYALVMCNDHIPSIRSVAFKYVTASIPKCAKTRLFEILPEINRLSNVERIEIQRRKSIQECYFTTVSHILDIETIMNMEPTKRLMLNRWYAESPTTEWQDIVDELYSVESDPCNKIFLFKVLVRDSNDPKPLYLLGMKSKLNQIRAIALQGYYDKVQDYWPGVEDFLLDRCSKVQDIAIYIMKKHKGVSVGTLLAPLIQPNCSIAVAKGMLSWQHSCDKNCARKLIEHLKYFKGKKLAASIKACSAVLKDEGVDEYLKYLDNESNKVSKEASRALRKTYIPEAKIRAIGYSAKTIRGKQNAEQLIKDQRERKRKLPYPYTNDQEVDIPSL